MYTVFPLQRSEAEWLEDAGVVFFSWALFNPNGPTFSCLGLRETGARAEQEIFFRWMHFLGGEDYCLGYVDGADPDWDTQLKEALAHAFAQDVGDGFRRYPMMNVVPSFARSLMNDDWDREFRALLAGTAAFREANWGRERHLLQKYGSSLFSRAGEETREVYEQMLVDATDENTRPMLEFIRQRHERIDGWQQWTPNAYESRRMQDGDVDAWWSTVATDEFLMEASLACAQAWIGAPRQSGLEVKTTFDQVAAFLRHYRHEIWPAQLTSAWLEASLGFKA